MSQTKPRKAKGRNGRPRRLELFTNEMRNQTIVMDCDVFEKHLATLLRPQLERRKI